MLVTAKVAVVGLFTLLVGEVLSFVSFFEGQAVLSGGAPTASLSQPGVLRAVALSGAFLALFALLGLGIGLVVRHTAGAVGVFAGVTFLVPILLNSISHSVARLRARTDLRQLHRRHGRSARPRRRRSQSESCCMLVYCAAALGLGAFLLQRRDA